MKYTAGTVNWTVENLNTLDENTKKLLTNWLFSFTSRRGPTVCGSRRKRKSLDVSGRCGECEGTQFMGIIT